MTASPGFTYENDILGNRTWRNRYVPTGGMRYLWDELNRATSICGTASGARYEYRPDGMRTLKVEGLTLSWTGDPVTGSGWYDPIWAVNQPTTRYYYDGQMLIEDDHTVSNGAGADVTNTRYGIGARGIDYIDKFFNGAWQGCQFPIYDGHGNMVATLARSGASYTLANKRSYDVWGSVRSQSSVDPPNGPKARYCANLGHVQDDESSLIYMRARYYEPWTGRFVSEDRACDGRNWFVYARCNPVNLSDSTGNSTEYYPGINRWLGVITSLAMMMAAAKLNPAVRAKAIADLGFLVAWWGLDVRGSAGEGDIRVIGGLLLNAMVDLIVVSYTWHQYAAEIAKSSNPLVMKLALIGEHVAFISLFMSLEEIGERG